VLTRKTKYVKALNGVSFGIRLGETLGVVGESGCGKTTLGRLILRLIEPKSGKIFFLGQNILLLPPNSLRQLRKEMQIVFQDPYGSLNPRMRLEDIVSQGLRAHHIGSPHERREKALQLLETVGLKADHALRYPHEFSGGQRQRIALARALAVNPSFIIREVSNGHWVACHYV
jgi:ABC-type oligopeptide transport system ATPase subunit